MGKYIAFSLNNESYGFPIEVVKEINRYQSLTPIPSAPTFIKGVMNLRGKIVPVADLRMKFGFPENERNRETSIIIIEAPLGLVGLIVDSVNEVRDIPPEIIDPPIRLNGQENFIQGFGKMKDGAVIIIVDVLKAFSENLISEITEISHDMDIKEAS